jgi:hypothetical protein
METESHPDAGDRVSSRVNSPAFRQEWLRRILKRPPNNPIGVVANRR